MNFLYPEKLDGLDGVELVCAAGVLGDGASYKTILCDGGSKIPLSQ